MPPKVVADANRHSLSTATSTTRELDDGVLQHHHEAVGHGFSQDNLNSGMACYSFVPKSDIPIKIIVLDDTVKGPDQADYAAGALDDERYQWLVDELHAGQAANQLMVIAAHVPILPQNSLTDTTPFPMWPGPEYTDDYVLNMLHTYPNLILWMAGHRHVNVVTPQPDPSGDPTLGFWEVETCSLRDHPQQFRTFDIRRNQRQHGVDHHHECRSGGAAATRRHTSRGAMRWGHSGSSARLRPSSPTLRRTPTMPSWWCS